jgi:hypothetical protein
VTYWRKLLEKLNTRNFWEATGSSTRALDTTEQLGESFVHLLSGVPAHKGRSVRVGAMSIVNLAGARSLYDLRPLGNIPLYLSLGFALCEAEARGS